MRVRVDYEARILRSAIIYPQEILFKVVYGLEADDFSNPQWRKIFNKLKQIAEAGKIDHISLMDGLSDAALAPETVLNSWDNVYTADTIDEPINTIKNRSRLSQLRTLYGDALKEAGRIDTDAEKHITKIIHSLADVYSATGARDIGSVIDDLTTKASQYVGKTMFGVPYGVAQMDELTKGMQPGHLWLMRGYTSMGKTWFAIRAMREFLRANKPVLYLSFEMGAEELIWRFAVMDLDDPSFTITKAKTRVGATREQVDRLKSELQMIKSYPLSIVDNLFSLDEVKLRILHEIHANKVECVIVDYIQNVSVPKASGEYESLNRIVLELQTIARKNQVFVLALSQVNRESQRSNNERVFGFKGSGNLENAADIAITINPVEADPFMRTINVGKNREGLTGEISCKVDFSCGSIKPCLNL